MLADGLVRAGLPRPRVQARLQLVAVAVPALSLLLLSWLEGRPRAAGVLVTAWLGCTSFHSAGATAVLHSIGGRRAGELFVLGNTFAKLGALLSTRVTRWALDVVGWPTVLGGLAVGYVLAGALLLPRMARVDEAARFVANGEGAPAAQEKKAE